MDDLLELSGECVLVTGCSSGIGRATALYLAEQGFTVFATVRKQADADALNAIELPGLVPICPLDLTIPEQIEQVARTIQAELRTRGKEGLYAIVNNAGGGGIAPIELMDLDAFRTELETRVVGPVALLQHLLPAIRQGRGRLVWIATPALVAIPYVSSIHAPEFAMNCIAHTLQLELRRWDVPNILIKCGGIDTPSPQRSAEEFAAALGQWPPEKVQLYAQAFERLLKRLNRFDAGRTPAEDVAAAIYRALTAPHPRRIYRVGKGSRGLAVIRHLPQAWIDAIMARAM